MHLKKHLLTLSITSALVACGGSGSETNNGVTPVESVNVSGKVIDGYIQGAIVYLDLNLNRQLDEGEPFTTSDNTGSYQLTVLETQIEQAQKAPIRAYVGDGAVDLDTGEEFSDSPVLLSTPPLTALSIHTTPPAAAITPFTTDLNSKVEETLEQVVAGTVELSQLLAELQGAKAELAEEYGVDDKEALLGDFLDEGNVDAELREELRGVAEQRVKELQKDHQRQKEAEEQAEDGQIVKTGSTRESFVEWHTGELLHLLVEWQEVITVNEDGSRAVEKSGVKYFCESDYTLKVDGSGEPIAYERYSVTQNLDGQGGFTALTKFNIDKNGDGNALFFGQSYSIGEVSEDMKTWEFIEYFDEGNPSDDDASLQDLGRVYDNIDIVTAVAEKDLSEIDMIQYKRDKTELTESGNLVNTYNFHEYQADSFESLDSSSPKYMEMRSTTTNLDRTIHIVEKDWGADGSINERSEQVSYASGSTTIINANPVWAWRGDDIWEEYADYRYDGGPLISYWYEKETTTETVDGVKTKTTNGKRYVLEDETLTAGEDKELFHEFTSTSSYLSDELTIEVANWTHYALEAYDFTVVEENVGHKVTYWQLESPDFNLWVGHEFAEIGSLNVTDLAEQLAVTLESDITFENITEEHIESLSTYNRELFTSSFIYDEDGQARTWYNVWSENALDLQPNWTLEELTLDEEGTDLVFIAESGGMFAMSPHGSGAICSNESYCIEPVELPLVEFDAETGSFFTYFAGRSSEPNYFFQSQAEAEAKLTELEAIIPQTKEYYIDFILDVDATEADFDGWGIHIWNHAPCQDTYVGHENGEIITEWESPLLPSSFTTHSSLNGDVIAARFEIEVYDSATCANFVIHKGNEKAYEDDMAATLTGNKGAVITYDQADIQYVAE
ncbi:hypothetical protein [Agarivorans sp. Alg241-V36]|uniref:hypothetical protein n=1 Tax=Agarivorans sp. Alg241-V36 TaxID=2305992 RepID=UPI0013D1D3B1|nr:hypothetical protein [Agarivorans sp. Alg241-V36]